MPSAWEERLGTAIAGLDVEGLRQRFQAEGEFLFLEQFLPADLVADLVSEIRPLLPRAHRAYVPFVRKAGTIGQGQLAREAPRLDALYRSAEFRAFASRLTDQELVPKGDTDAHAAALYVYDRRGDHVAFHYDDCGCDGASFTATLGLIDRSTSRVEMQLDRQDPTRPRRDKVVSMAPGSLLFFRGSKVYHRVTPLGDGEERAVFSCAYVEKNKQARGKRRFWENAKDALLFFGPKALFQKNYR